MPTIDELNTELAALNAAVESAVRARRAWMDQHMADYAKFKVGDELIDMNTGRFIGTVCELYRYWGGRDDRYDTSMDIDYKYREPSPDGYNFVDNTSRQPGLRVGTRKEYAEWAEVRAKAARAAVS